MSFEEEHPAIRIPIAGEFINTFFEKHDVPILVEEGIVGDYKVRGVIQDYNTGIFYILLSTDKSDGYLYKDFLPVYKKVDCLDKQRVREAINKVKKEWNVSDEDYPEEYNREHSLIKAIEEELGLS